MTRWYCTLNALKDELGETGTANDARLRRYIGNASNAIEAATGRTFVPVTATKYFDVPDTNDRLFLAYEDLLSLTTLSDDTGTITSTYYWLYPLNLYPKHSIVLNVTDLGRAFEYNDDPNKVITIVGRWGYCEDTVATGLTLGAAIASTTATSIVLSGAGCEIGWTLLVNTEAMFVSNVTGNVATVERGANGTTAATHLISAAVSRYVIPSDIEQACLEMALHTNNTRAAGGIRQETIGEYSVSYGTSAAIPATASAVMRRYQRLGA
jgi:hypothetical protein